MDTNKFFSIRRKLFYIFLAISLSFGINILYIRTFESKSAGELYSTNDDEANNLTMELMTNDKDILKKDPFFPQAMYGRNIPFCYRAFWSCVGYLGKILGNLELANALITFIFSIIFISGLCVLCWHLSSDPYVGILVAVFSSIPMEATGGVTYGLGYLFNPATLNRMFNYLSPWFLLLFFKTVMSFDKFLLFFLFLALLTNFYLLGASLLMIVILMAIIIMEIKLWSKKGSFHLWKIILFASIIVISALPHLINFKDDFGISTQHIPMEWVRFRFVRLYYDYTLIIDKITFWAVPIVFGVFGYWLKKRNGERWKSDDLISALFYSILIVTVFGIFANYNRFFIRFFIDRVSVYLYLIAFLYAAYAVVRLFKKRGGVYIALSILIASLLIVPKGKVLVPFLRQLEEVIIPSKRIPHLIEKEQERKASLDVQTRKALKASFLNMADWVKKNTDVDDIFIIPLERRFPAFRYYAKRPIVVDWKSGSAILQSSDLGYRWIVAYTLLEDAYKNLDEKKFIYIAKRFNASYLVMYRNVVYLNLPIVYQSEHFLIYKMADAG